MKNKNHWQPKEGETYYYISLGGHPYIFSCTWAENFGYDESNYEAHNCFRTKKEAEAKLKEILKVLEGDNKQ